MPTALPPTSTPNPPPPSSMVRLVDRAIRREEQYALRCLIWLLMEAQDRHPEFRERVQAAWRPTRESLADLLEVSRPVDARCLLWLIDQSKLARRLLRDLRHLVELTRVGQELHFLYAPSRALEAERHLEQLLSSLESGGAWTNPRDVLDPQRERGVELAPIYRLAENRRHRHPVLYGVLCERLQPCQR